MATAPGDARTARWTPEVLKWGDVVDMARSPASTKHAGGIFWGRLSGTRRLSTEVVDRCVVAVDIDACPVGFVDDLVAEFPWRALVHSTASSTPQAPRWRVLVPLARPVSPAESEAVHAAVIAAVNACELLGTDVVDPCSDRLAQFYYRPGTTDPANYAWHEIDRPVLDPAEVLADWCPPIPETAKGERVAPEDLPGLVGLFNRAYDVPAAIDAFGLPYAPAGGGRYAFADGHGVAGLVLLEDGRAFSHHSTDPAAEGGHALTSWDLVRVHACEGDEARMTALAESDPLVALAVIEDARDTFDDLTAAERADLDTDETPAPVASSWTPLDMSAIVAGILDGTLETPRPEVGWMDDGTALFYRGCVNGLAGESGAGKSWTALVVAAQVLADGEACIYVDLEDSPASIVGRLLTLGVDPDAIAARFVYVHPDEAFTPAAARGMADVMDRCRPLLVVIDSTGESLAAEGANPNADEEVARWFQRLPRRLAAHPCRPAVLVLDHITKANAAEGGAMSPIGSQRKRAAIDGAQYMQRLADAFDRTTPGSAVLTSAKDRHGHHARGQRVATLYVDPATQPLARLAAVPQYTPADVDEINRVRVDAYLRSEVPDGETVTQRQLTAAVQGNDGAIIAAAKWLAANGYVEITKRGQANRYRSVRPYAPDLPSGGSDA